jgi:hypothetical protein
MGVFIQMSRGHFKIKHQSRVAFVPSSSEGREALPEAGSEVSIGMGEASLIALGAKAEWVSTRSEDVETFGEPSQLVLGDIDHSHSVH